MDYMGILREAWDVTKRNRSLWILGLFAAGGASFSANSNWNSNSNSSSSKGSPTWTPPEGAFHSPNQALQYGLDQAGRQLHMPMGTPAQWWAGLAIAAVLLLLVGLVCWAIGIWARGGLIDQTREALAGRPASASAGWRSGLRFWGRVFLVGFLLGLPLLALGLMGLATLVVFGAPAIATGGHGSAVVAGLVGMGVVLSAIGLVALVVGLIVSMIEEVALRRAILGDQLALDSIRGAWRDLRGKRGVASMWLVMILVNIAAGIAAGILFIPVALVTAIVVGGAVYTAGLSMLWLLAPFALVFMGLGMLFKAVYDTFRNTAWTSFYLRLEHPQTDAAEPVPPVPPVPSVA